MAVLTRCPHWPFSGLLSCFHLCQWRCRLVLRCTQPVTLFIDSASKRIWLRAGSYRPSFTTAFDDLLRARQDQRSSIGREYFKEPKVYKIIKVLSLEHHPSIPNAHSTQSNIPSVTRVHTHWCHFLLPRNLSCLFTVFDSSASR